MARLPTPPEAPVTYDRSALRDLPVLLHAMDGERSGEASGAERHDVESIHALRSRMTQSALTRAISA